MGYMEFVNNTKVKKDEIAIFWLGQAGFLLKNSKNKVLAIDLYLSDLVENEGIKRLMMKIVKPKELTVDVILATHWHGDHLDVLSLPDILANGGKLYCDSTSFEICNKCSMNTSVITTMNIGDIIEDSGFIVEAVAADHGDTAPEALGYIVKTEGVKLYFTGDTSYHKSKMQYGANQKIDVLIVPINGEYGNMNERDAAMCANLVMPRLTIPSHFWMFARHKGSPYEFELAMNALAPKINHYAMCQGECLIFDSQEGIKKHLYMT